MKIDAGKWLGSTASLLSSLVSMTCPLCIPGAAALITSIGLGVAITVELMQGILILLLLISVGSLVWAARLHKRRWIVGAGVAGATLIYGGRYIWFSTALMGVGAALLIGTSLMNLGLKRRACCKCEQAMA
ncbi:MAG: MerC family mercury resistance protein [Verrucomicrobia subdivision 3 bacterium]|nr:MerC family mercury resistance protein [Limisphaerales bacterium]